MRLADVADEIGAAVHILSRHRLGATIVWDPATVVDGGVRLDAIVSRELLTAIFVPDYINRIHRGPVVIRRHRIERAGARSDTSIVAGALIAVDDATGDVWWGTHDLELEVICACALASKLHRYADAAGSQ